MNIFAKVILTTNNTIKNKLIENQVLTQKENNENYEIYLSEDGLKWEMASKGVFQNIRQTLVPQEIKLNKVYRSRYLKFVVNGVLEKNFISVAEIGVRTVD